ncbi:MAG: TonB-dependent receptor [Gammaproteobacteria bacterium]|nr:TonB-dependent receptor [Gammaproteobacteria bacterium]
MTNTITYPNLQAKGRLTKKLLAKSIIAANLMAAGAFAPAFAQESQQQGPLEEIVVTAGFRGSLEAALDAKRHAIGAVDSIMAEDIADFPDTNLAESLQRIPGVAISREAGEGREITVRGLDATYTRVMINNAMGQSLSAGSNGVRTSRAFDFNVFASELFNRIDLHKSQSAELEEGSLGATVNLHTGRPFDYEPVAIALNLQGAYNEQSEKTKPRGSGLFSFSNEEQTFGALLSVASSQRYVSNIGADSGRWEFDDTFASCSACADSSEVDAVNNAWHPRFPRYADKLHDEERTGVTAAFQFRPTDSTLITVDALQAKVESRRDEPFMQAISLARTGSTGVQQTDVADYTIDSNNTLIAATMDGVDVRSEAFVAEWESEFTQYAFKLEQDFGDKMRVTAMYGTSESVLDNRETTLIYEHFSPTDSGKKINYADNSSAVTYDFRNMTSPDISYGFDTANPANWEVSEFRDRIYDASSESDSLKLDLEYDLSDSLVLKAGMSEREYSYDIKGTRADRSFSSADGRDGAVDNVACGISAAVTSDMGSVKNFGKQSFFIADEALFANFANSDCWPASIRAGDTRNVVEEATGYYVQLDFDTDVAGYQLRGNVGVREVETRLSATGINSGQTVTVDHEYSDTLPSLNLALNLSEDVVVRASWAEVMSRPNLTDLNPGGSVTIFGVPAVSYGNPFLEPFRATTTDLSVEWYFDDGALLSLAYFIKDIESFPSSETTVINWQNTGLPDSLLGSQINDLINADFEVTRKINGGGGKLDGWELQYQQNMTFLPEGWLQNLGVIGNVTLVDSKVDATGLALEGQSDLSYNFTVFYEDDKFSTRLAYSYRDEYTTDNDSNPDRIRYRDETGNLDFSASYQINDNFRVTLEGLNLTDEPARAYMSPSVGRLINEENTGTQWLVGMSYKY